MAFEMAHRYVGIDTPEYIVTFQSRENGVGVWMDRWCTFISLQAASAWARALSQECRLIRVCRVLPIITEPTWTEALDG